MATSIALDGVGGQGVRVIAGVLGNLLARMGKQVTVLFDYDSSVRGSMSDAFVIFDDAPIANPVVEDADILLKLANRGHLRIQGRKVVSDLGLASPGDEQIPFAALGSQHFGKELFGNMIALGRLLRLAAIDYNERAIRELIRRKPDATLAEVAEAIGKPAHPGTVSRTLRRLNLPRKKRPRTPPSRTGRM